MRSPLPMRAGWRSRILEAFKHSVEQSGASFVVVHLPRRGDLRVLAATGALPNADLLRQVAARFEFVRHLRCVNRRITKNITGIVVQPERALLGRRQSRRIRSASAPAVGNGLKARSKHV